PLSPPGDDAVLLQWTGSWIEAYPNGRLLYFPVDSPSDLASVFAAAETMEYRSHDYSAAVAAFRALAESSQKEVRAGALIGLARNLRQSIASDVFPLAPTQSLRSAIWDMEFRD
ncbi:MAG TPA: hypothetical protein VGR71_04375, partial [Nitrospira sp.]|nr:hypothetical protein [Nitrospira sp.]